MNIISNNTKIGIVLLLVFCAAILHCGWLVLRMRCRIALSDGFEWEYIGENISRIIKDGKPGKHVKYLAVGCAIIVAMVYAFWMHPYIEPIMNSYEAGWFEYVRTTISIGVFGFLLMYALLHLRASKRM